jgi:hypothetical protein
MNDHETFLLLSAKRIDGRLSHEEEAALEAHLAGCPSCRVAATGMRRDDLRLRAALAPVEVAPRVRDAILAQTAGSGQRVAGRVALLMAAALVIALVGVPFIAGGPRGEVPSAVPPSMATVIPSASEASPSVDTPVPPSSPPVPSGVEPFVVGAYTYQEQVERRDTITVRREADGPVGEWSRTTTVRGGLQSYGGPITCFELDGSEAWLAGPAETATDGRTGLAIFFHYRDGGADGVGDLAIGWLSTPGQTLATMEGWCRLHADPAGPFELTSGDVEVQPGP